MFRVLNAAVMATLLTGAAQASPAPFLGDPARALPKATALDDGELTLAPLAFVQFCTAYAHQCRGGGEARVGLTPALWAAMETVNAAVNRRIAPNAGKGGFNWSLDTRYGNCNDYAVQKRSELIARGFPASALSLAAVVTGRGEDHLVLTVRTDRGDFVLDNLNRRVVAWNATGYRWLKRQSAERPQYWVSVEAGRPVRPGPAPNGLAVARRDAPHAPEPKRASTPPSFDHWPLRPGADG